MPFPVSHREAHLETCAFLRWRGTSATEQTEIHQLRDLMDPAGLSFYMEHLHLSKVLLKKIESMSHCFSNPLLKITSWLCSLYCMKHHNIILGRYYQYRVGPERTVWTINHFAFFIPCLLTTPKKPVKGQIPVNIII